MKSKVIKTVKTADARVMLVLHSNGKYTVEVYDYETEVTYGKRTFYTSLANAERHFNKAI